MKHSHICVALLALVVSAALGGCSEFPHVDHAYGDSYTAMIQRETFNPEAAMAAEHGPAPGGGMRLENVLKAHHHAVSHAVTSQVRTGRFQTGSGTGGG